MFRHLLIYFYDLFSKADDTEGIKNFQKVKNKQRTQLQTLKILNRSYINLINITNEMQI